MIIGVTFQIHIHEFEIGEVLLPQLLLVVLYFTPLMYSGQGLSTILPLLLRGQQVPISSVVALQYKPKEKIEALKFILCCRNSLYLIPLPLL